MSILRVRYRTGDTDEWTVHERMNADELQKALMKALTDGDRMSFTCEIEGSEVDYARVAINFKDVVMWEIDGLLDEDRIAFIALGDAG